MVIDMCEQCIESYGRLKNLKLVGIDVFVCFAYDKDGGYQTLVIPGDLCRFMQTISLTESKKGKWWDYAMTASEIRPFLIAISATGSAKAARSTGPARCGLAAVNRLGRVSAPPSEV